MLLITQKIIRFLLLKFGGPDLKHFCNDEIIEYLKTDKQEKTGKFG